MWNSLVISRSMYLNPLYHALLLLSLATILSGCLSFRPPAELKFTSGAAVESLSGTASLSYATSARSISGSGVLVYRKPDRMRVIILSPFGSVLQEIYINGDLVTIIEPGNGIAFSGTSADLPAKGDFSSWRYIRWLIDFDPPDSSRNSSVVERINRFGMPEKAVFENGLLISKATAEGGYVTYSRYTALQGVALPLEITYETGAKEKFSIIFEDPEINMPVADGAFTPNLSKLRVYPLSTLK